MGKDYSKKSGYKEVDILEIVKPTAGKFHSWVKTKFGLKRKPNSKINN